MFQYQAHGLKIHSQLEFPELSAENLGAGCDVRIQEASLPALDGEAEVLCRAGLDSCDLQFRGVVRVSVRQGNSILWQALGTDFGRLRLFLLNSAISAVLAQRGSLVLHAGCVAAAGRAVALAGHSGAGKSTLTAALVERGYPLISDDQVSIDARGVATGYPFLRLWPPSFDFLTKDAAHFPPLSADCPKRLVPCPVPRTPLPPGMVLVLEKGAEFQVQELKPLDAAVALVAHSFQARWGRQGVPPQLSRAHFQACTRLAREVPVVRLQRPAERGSFQDYLKIIMERIDKL